VYLLSALSACKKSDPICNEWTFYIPNSFTPNADGNSDIFEPKGTGVMQYQMKIFDGNGQLLYTTPDLNAGWDGTKQGNGCPEGIYNYVIKATDNCGYQHTYTGDITLLK